MGTSNKVPRISTLYDLPSRKETSSPGFISVSEITTTDCIICTFSISGEAASYDFMWQAIL